MFCLLKLEKMDQKVNVQFVVNMSSRMVLFLEKNQYYAQDVIIFQKMRPLLNSKAKDKVLHKNQKSRN